MPVQPRPRLGSQPSRKLSSRMKHQTASVVCGELSAWRVAGGLSIQNAQHLLLQPSRYYYPGLLLDSDLEGAVTWRNFVQHHGRYFPYVALTRANVI